MGQVFPELSPEWFRRHGSLSDSEAEAAHWEWLAWSAKRNRDDEAKRRMAVRLALRLSDGAVRHYLKGRADKLADQTWTLLDKMYTALGGASPEKRRKHKQVSPRKGRRRIALLVDLAEIPSPDFHLEVLRGLVHSASFDQEAILHDVSGTSLASAVNRLWRLFEPDAVVMIRLTPDEDTIHELAQHQLPAVLVHADRYKYPPPVLANIVPAQERIPELLKDWSDRVLRGPTRAGFSTKSRPEQVVVVAMPHEEKVLPFDAIDGVRPSIRNERIDLVRRGLAAWESVAQFEVDNYTFAQAINVFRDHRESLGFVCLSDQIAVALKHLFVAAGRNAGDFIVGFDGSRLAADANVRSFGQSLDEIGHKAIGRLEAWFDRSSQGPASGLQGFDEVRLPLTLV
jgi:DNA-binding LacI/PurR family transcriptional regulator